jgi:hypothetical protein
MPTRPKTGLLLFFSGGQSDTTRPTVAITASAVTITAAAFTCTFTFSEDVSGFELGDITVANGTAGTFATTSASVYTAVITPTATGAVTVDVAEGVCQDAAGNTNTAATQFSVLYVAAAAWYDPSDVSTLFQDAAGTTPVTTDGQIVQKMADKSGNNNHLLQSTSGREPLYKVNIQNGKAIIRCDGVDDYLQSLAYALTAPVWIVMVCNQQLWTINRNIISDGPGGATSMQLYRQTATPRITMYGSADGPTTTEMTVGAFHSVEMLFHGAGSYIKIDNNADITGNPGTHTMSGLTLAASKAGASRSQIDFGEIFVFSNLSPSAGQRAAMQSYINTKWGF